MRWPGSSSQRNGRTGHPSSNPYFYRGIHDGPYTPIRESLIIRAKAPTLRLSCCGLSFLVEVANRDMIAHKRGGRDRTSLACHKFHPSPARKSTTTVFWGRFTDGIHYG